MLLIMAIVILGCEKREDPFEADNTYPIMTIKSTANVNKYEIKVGTYQNNHFDTIVNIFDTIKNDFNQIFLSISTENEGHHLKKYQISYNDTITIAELNLIIKNKGNYPNYTRDTVLVSATDYYNKTTTARIIICYIENLNPYTRFKVTKIGNVSPYEIRVDASDSYDSDSRYGGAIVAYHFDIAGYTVQNDDPILNHVLPGPGTYTIKVKVLDNNGQWSQEIQQTIDV